MAMGSISVQIGRGLKLREHMEIRAHTIFEHSRMTDVFSAPTRYKSSLLNQVSVLLPKTVVTPCTRALCKDQVDRAASPRTQ
jgi:hypothetical protein